METVKPTIAERSITTNLLVDVLSMGETELSYDALSMAVGADVRKECPGALSSARRIVRREHGIEYQTIRRVGLRRMTSKDAPTVGMASISKMHREAKRGIERMGCANVAELDNDDKVKFNAVASGLGAISVVTNSRSIKKLESAVVKSSEQLTLSDTLKEFGGERN